MLFMVYEPNSSTLQPFFYSKSCYLEVNQLEIHFTAASDDEHSHSIYLITNMSFSTGEEFQFSCLGC